MFLLRHVFVSFALSICGACDADGDVRATSQAGSDAAVDIDARGPNDLIDARGPNELVVDGSSDATCLFEPFAKSCVVRAEPSVSCGPYTCSGLTPLCCRLYDAGLVPFCVATAEACRSSDAFDRDTLSSCDDSGDCAPGTVCGTVYNKGLGVHSGAACFDRCESARHLYFYRECGMDCECEDGLRCTAGLCQRR